METGAATGAPEPSTKKRASLFGKPESHIELENAYLKKQLELTRSEVLRLQRCLIVAKQQQKELKAQCVAYENRAEQWMKVTNIYNKILVDCPRCTGTLNWWNQCLQQGIPMATPPRWVPPLPTATPGLAAALAQPTATVTSGGSCWGALPTPGPAQQVPHGPPAPPTVSFWDRMPPLVPIKKD